MKNPLHAPRDQIPHRMHDGKGCRQAGKSARTRDATLALRDVSGNVMVHDRVARGPVLHGQVGDGAARRRGSLAPAQRRLALVQICFPRRQALVGCSLHTPPACTTQTARTCCASCCMATENTPRWSHSWRQQGQPQQARQCPRRQIHHLWQRTPPLPPAAQILLHRHRCRPTHRRRWVPGGRPAAVGAVMQVVQAAARHIGQDAHPAHPKRVGTTKMKCTWERCVLLL